MIANPLIVTAEEAKMMSHKKVNLFRPAACNKVKSTEIISRSDLYITEDDPNIYSFIVKDNDFYEDRMITMESPYGAKGTVFWVKEPCTVYEHDNKTYVKYGKRSCKRGKGKKIEASKMPTKFVRYAVQLEETDLVPDFSGKCFWKLQFTVFSCK